MAYHVLANESGGDASSRVSEAHMIVRLLEDETEQMTPKERTFIEQMADCDFCTTKQIFWLRDIKDKYL